MPGEINWKEKIAENQQFRSTWKVEIDGKEYIAKKIETDNAEKRESLAKQLRKQVRFSEILNEEEKKKICLFETCREEGNSIVFLRSFLKGSSLAEHLLKKRYTVPEAVGLILQIARIVQTAHTHDVFHGDLKPANIIVADTGEIAIIDWDTMRISDSVRRELIGGDVTREQVSGTPQYMPIEQFQGKPLAAQNDIYALGVILYQLLTGETPFDFLNGKTSAEIAMYKQRHEPDSILVKHPEFGVPADIAKIIEDALKNDLNQRIQSIDVFIRRLETIGKITASAAGNQPPEPGPSSDYVPAEKKGKEHKIVLIGHTGAGKTVFATGLYATQDKDFAVDVADSQSPTGIFAVNTRTNIEEGHWPAATSVSEIMNLKFKLNHKGREEAITFDEYAGERLKMKYFKETLKDAEGAFILINPGGEQWHKHREKNELLCDLKHYIDLLSQMENRPPIALVITASDRLESDLRNFAPEFQKYVDELEQYLVLQNCVYKVFKVTVSGILENQEQPRLAPQGVKDPFLWLLEQFSSRARKKFVKKAFIAAALVAAVLLLGWAVECIREYSNVSSFHAQFIGKQTEFNEKKNRLNYRSALVDLRNSACTQKHLDKTKKNGDCSAECRSRKYRFLMSSFAAKFDRELEALEREIDSVNEKIFEGRLTAALENPTDDNRKVQDHINEWQPLRDKKAKDELKRKCDAELPLAIEKYDTRQLREDLQKLIQNPQTVFPDELAQKYEGWRSKPSVLPPDERSRNIAEIDNMFKEAAERVFECGVSTWKKRIIEFDGTNGTVSDLTALVTEFYSFRNQRTVKIDPETVSQKHTELEGKLVETVESFIDAQQAKAQEKLMASDVYQEPSYAKEVKNRICPHFPEEIRTRLAARIDERLSSGKQAWEKKQEEIVDDFIRSIQYLSAGVCLDRYKEFSFERGNNPYLSKAENKVVEIVSREFQEKLDNFDYSESAYRAVKELAVKTRATTSAKLKDSWPFRFSNAYIGMMDESHYINITRVEVSSSYKDGAYITTCSYQTPNILRKQIFHLESYKEEERGIFRSDWQDLYRFKPIKVACEPWEKFTLIVHIWENVDWGRDTDKGSWEPYIEPGRPREYYKDCYRDGVQMRIYYSINYKTIAELRSEVK